MVILGTWLRHTDTELWWLLFALVVTLAIIAILMLPEQYVFWFSRHETAARNQRHDRITLRERCVSIIRQAVEVLGNASPLWQQALNHAADDAANTILGVNAGGSPPGTAAGAANRGTIRLMVEGENLSVDVNGHRVVPPQP